MPEPAISVRDLRKAYGGNEAVRGVDLEVAAGEVFAFLGPNGAGKTTTVEILEGYRERSGGEVSVLGTDPARADRDWRERIGIVLQQTRMHPELTVHETLALFAGYYRAPRDVEETIELVGLRQRRDTRVARLSGGQQRRLDVALALVGNPELLFLDEPTTGFDPSARRRAWEVIASLRELGKTVFLTTHYMDEAQVLADHVAIIVAGRIIAQGPPNSLGEHAATEIRVAIPNGVDPFAIPLEGGTVAQEGRFLVITTPAPARTLNQLTAWALESGHDLAGIEVGSPSLEDVYLELTEENG